LKISQTCFGNNSAKTMICTKSFWRFWRTTGFWFSAKRHQIRTSEFCWRWRELLFETTNQWFCL